jgi:3-oxoacyl-[acyl-carrier-protein] synthase-3
VNVFTRSSWSELLRALRLAQGIATARARHNSIQKYGNTTAASIPICMHEAIELGKIKPGSLVCLVAFGAGLTWGSVFLRY